MFEIKPKTRKEIYMAYLAGNLSLELPEPMTRDEVTLYNLCQSHAYGSTTTVKEVLEECQPELVADMGMFMLSTVPEIEAGAEYIVNWNGVEHKCTAILASEDAASRNIALGNMSADGGEDTGEPFLLVAQYGEQAGCFVAPLDGSTTVTISIRQEVTTVAKISGKFVEGMGWSEKTAKEELSETTVTEDLFETDGGDSGEVFAKIDIPTLVLGDKYTVTFDGTVYELECFVDLELPTIGAPFGDWSSYPFAINSDSGFQYLCLPKAGTHTISIRHEAETIHPIEQKFLPSGGGEFVVTFTEDGDNISADKSISELITADKSNMSIRAVYDYGDGEKEFYHLVGVQSYKGSPMFMFHCHSAYLEEDEVSPETSEMVIMYSDNGIFHNTFDT